MALTTIGRNYVADAFRGGSDYTKVNNANAYLCVGNSSTVFAVGQTDMQGASKYRQGMDATYPTRSTNVDTYRATFASGNANFAWEEWGLANHASAGELLTRKVESLGTKVSGATWEFTTTFTWT